MWLRVVNEGRRRGIRLALWHGPRRRYMYRERKGLQSWDWGQAGRITVASDWRYEQMALQERRVRLRMTVRGTCGFTRQMLEAWVGSAGHGAKDDLRLLRRECARA